MRVFPLVALCLTLGTSGAAYDPLSLPAEDSTSVKDTLVHDTSRQRDIPIRIFLPAEKKPARVVLFSHGLGGAREGAPYLGRHWAARGYAVVYLQHPGSDRSVWADVENSERLEALRAAASLENFLHRVQDVPAVLDQLAKWNADRVHFLGGRLDLSRVGMSGHSFGALTTQAVSGQSLPRGGQRFTDSRIKAAIAFSPSAPRRGAASPGTAFGAVKIPWLLMTGTNDTSPIGDIHVESRLGVYPALRAGDKYELVLHGAEHSAFSDRALPGDRKPRDPNHHRIILALSTAFWDAYLAQDITARKWLQSDAPQALMASQDRWLTK